MLDLTLAASGATALRERPLLRNPLLARVLGLYLAIAAGTIQLADIVVDRLALPERLFVFAIVLAIVGIPIVITATLFVDVARAERRAPSRPGGAAATAADRAARGSTQPQLLAVPATPPSTAAETATLPARLELALSYRHIAQLHRLNGDHVAANARELEFEREAEQLINELRALIDGRTT